MGPYPTVNFERRFEELRRQGRYCSEETTKWPGAASNIPLEESCS